MFSKIVVRLSIPFLVASLLMMSILTIVVPASTIDTTPHAEGDQFVFLPVILKPSSPPGSNWIKMYSNSNDIDVSLSSFVQYSEDKYVISGWTKNPGYIGLITTVDGNGNILWQTGIEDGVGGLIATSDNHILGSGSSDDDHLVVMKFTPEGDIVWANQYGGDGKSVKGGATLELQDSSYVIAGETTGYGNGRSDAFVIKLNPNGSIVWQKTIGDINDEHIYAATVTSKNTIFLIGETSNPLTSYATPWLLELTADGTILWQKEIPDSECYKFNSIIELQDGNFLAAGRAGGMIPGCLLKLKDDGTIIWQKQVGESSYGEFMDVDETSDGTIIASGYKMKSGTTINDGWLMAFDIDGNVLWEKTYGKQDANLFTDIQILNSGQLAVSGYIYSFASEQTMGWLLKLDPDGSLDGCDLIQTGSSIITDTVPTATTINLGTTVPTSTMTTATYTLYDISLIPSQLCAEDSNLLACD